MTYATPPSTRLTAIPVVTNGPSVLCDAAALARALQDARSRIAYATGTLRQTELYLRSGRGTPSGIQTAQRQAQAMIQMANAAFAQQQSLLAAIAHCQPLDPTPAATTIALLR